MRYVICIESSHQMGMGHLFRSLNMAAALRSEGHEPTIVMNDDEQSIAVLRERDIPFYVEVSSYATDDVWEDTIIDQLLPDCWVNDRLNTSHKHAERIIGRGVQLYSMDDHGPGGSLACKNICALELSPTERSGNGLYGTNYMILNPEVRALRTSSPVKPELHSILVTLGGSDTYGVTPRIVTALAMFSSPLNISIILGPNFRNEKDLTNALNNAAHHTVEIKRNVPSLIEFLAQASLVICAGGITHFETTALGKPAVTVANERHEVPVTSWFAEKGCSIFTGFYQDPFEEGLVMAVESLHSNLERLTEMSRNALEAIDGKGLERVVGILTGQQL